MLYTQKEQDTAVFNYYRFVSFLIVVLIITGAVSAQESASIRATATVISPDIVKATASFETLEPSRDPYSKIVVLKPGNGNLQLNIITPDGRHITRRLESKNGSLYHRELLQSGKDVREESSLPGNGEDVTVVTFIYTDI